MKQGQTSSSDGVQNALFPMEFMYVTQGEYGDTSHQDSKAIDFGGRDSSGGKVNRQQYYAPFDCELTRITSDNAGMEFQSDGEVMTPKGKKKLTLVCYHDNDTPDRSTGEKISQGGNLAKTGTAGNVTGDHAHFEVFEQGHEWVDEYAISIYDAFFVDGTDIQDDGGYDWVETGEEIEIPDKDDLDLVCKNEYLSRDEMHDNAQYIAYSLTEANWSKEAIAGILGNMESESTMSPCLWQDLSEGSGGFGLVQWTPASKLIDWAEEDGKDPKDFDTQLDRILYEVENDVQWIETSDYNFTFKEFTEKSDESAKYMASAFLKNYERAGVEVEEERREQAQYWYKELEYKEGGGGGDGESPIVDIAVKHTELLLADTLNGWRW